jgi:hypothetical protein
VVETCKSQQETGKDSALIRATRGNLGKISKCRIGPKISQCRGVSNQEGVSHLSFFLVLCCHNRTLALWVL